MSDVLTVVDGRVGRVRLNRPAAIHALTLPMCETMLAALDRFEADAGIGAVVLDHAQGRGFCAGGDIRMLAESGAGDGSAARAFFGTEYRLNHRLFDFPKPTVAFMDGITMGGGVGLALPCDYRVATENTRFAMPETGIGLFPDVGGGWYLPRLPGRAGYWLALTGARIDGAECLSLGLASHYLPAAALDEAKARIGVAPGAIDEILRDLSVVPPPAKLDAHRPDIDRLFAGETVEAIFAALQADCGEWAAAQLAALRTKSPQTLKVALRQLMEGAAMPSFADEMVQEYAIGTRVVRMHDFLEGVRAVIVDKDNQPRWEPPTIETVSDTHIDAIFAPLPVEQRWSPQ